MTTETIPRRTTGTPGQNRFSRPVNTQNPPPNQTGLAPRQTPTGPPAQNHLSQPGINQNPQPNYNAPRRPPKRPHGIMTTSTPHHRADNNLKIRRRTTSPRHPRPRQWKDRSSITIRVRMFPRRLRLRHHTRRNRPSHRNHQTGLIHRVKTKTGGDIEARPVTLQSAAMEDRRGVFAFATSPPLAKSARGHHAAAI